MRDKLALFTDVKPEAVIESLDVDILYEVVLNMQKQSMDDVILKRLGLTAPAADLTEWRAMIDKIRYLKKEINITLVGKYADLQDAYISVNEALRAGGYAVDADVKITAINSEKVNAENVAEILADADGVMVPGGFGSRGTEGKMAAIQYARENNVPFLGVCLGMQLATVEFARNVLGHANANSIELDEKTDTPIIALMNDQKEITDRGGTMRLGLYPAKLKEGSLTKKLYGDKTEITARHRHRYEFNTTYRQELEEAGMVFVGTSPDETLMEIIEIPANDFFVAAQYHPEFTSRPNHPEPLYAGFVKAALAHHEN
jgi:CTP synthase